MTNISYSNEVPSAQSMYNKNMVGRAASIVGLFYSMDLWFSICQYQESSDVYFIVQRVLGSNKGKNVRNNYNLRVGTAEKGGKGLKVLGIGER